MINSHAHLENHIHFLSCIQVKKSKMATEGKTKKHGKKQFEEIAEDILRNVKKARAEDREFYDTSMERHRLSMSLWEKVKRTQYIIYCIMAKIR